MGDSSSNAPDSDKVNAKLQNDTQRAKENIKNFNNGDFMSGKMNISTAEKVFSALGIHSNEVTQIELLEAPFDNAEITVEPLALTSNSSIPMAKLLKGIEKSYNPGKLLLDERAWRELLRQSTCEKKSNQFLLNSE